MKFITSMIMLTSAIVLVPIQSNANATSEINKWVGTWEQTSLSRKSAKEDCKIDQLLKFQYVFETAESGQLEGVITQTDYRFNLISPPNTACAFKETKSPYILFNVKKWQATFNVNQKDNTLTVTGHSGECLHDLCKSPHESDFTTHISLGDGLIIDDFGTSRKSDDIHLLGDEKRNTLLARAQTVAQQVEKYRENKNCSALYKMMKQNLRHRAIDDYVATCEKANKTKLAIASSSKVDKFLSFNDNASHWAIFINHVIYQDKTEINEHIYLVYEENTWKLWNVY